MFSEKLFRHKYDIDDIIVAFCGEPAVQEYIIDTHDGAVYRASSAPKSVTEKLGDGFVFDVTPLPDSFLSEMLTGFNFKRLSDVEKEHIRNALAAVHHMHQLPALFADEHIGGWLRHQVKQACLEWLDIHGMIPPSMRHTSEGGLADLSGQKITVNIR